MSTVDLRDRAAASTAEGKDGLWGIVDCARDRSLYRDIQQLGPDAACLFTGKLEPVLLAASPYLVRLRENASFRERWRSEGWGQAWGIVFRSDAAAQELLQFFRKKMDAHLPDGKRVLFRYYDPRVFRNYLPACSVGELFGWFESIEEYIIEDEAGTSTQIFRIVEGKLTTMT
jgi:hypothetical protein